jgi:hypothetical protein
MYEMASLVGDEGVAVAPHPAPHLLLTAAELAWWVTETGWGRALAPVLPRCDVGHGRPVLVVPGFLAGDVLTRGCVDTCATVVSVRTDGNSAVTMGSPTSSCGGCWLV